MIELAKNVFMGIIIATALILFGAGPEQGQFVEVFLIYVAAGAFFSYVFIDD